jgi:acetylornithine deacetylase
VHQLIEDAAKLLAFAWPYSEAFGQTTINIGTIRGGQAPNVFASDAVLTGMIRLSCSSEEARSYLAKLLNPTTTLRILSSSSPRSLHIVPGFETCHVSFGCDIPHMEKLGTPLLLGPGSILDAHTDGEKVRINDLHTAVNKYEQLCKSLM